MPRHSISSLRRHRLAVPVLGSVLALALYATSPVMTLLSVASALQHDDVGTVQSALDWRTVRAGLKADLGSGDTDTDGAVHLASARTMAPVQDELPDFGTSFASTIVSHVVDDVVTPEHLVSLLAHPAHIDAHAAPASSGALAMLGRIAHLGFASPTRFEASVRMDADPAAAPVAISMQIEKWHWKITRIHVPDQMLNPPNANNRT